MFQLLTPTAALLKSVTPRSEHHGEDVVVAISMRLQITGPNTLLDLLSPKLRHALYTEVEAQEQLPGVEISTPLLRFNAFESHALKACFEGWTLKVDHGVDEDDPITLGGAKVDAFKLDAMEGGTVKLDFRVGSNDVSAEEIGLLCGKLGSEISITLHAPENPADAIDGSTEAFERDHPDATDLFTAGADGDDERPALTEADAAADLAGEPRPDAGEPWPFPRPDATTEAPPQSVTIERSQPGTRTARGREKTKEALAAGAAAAGAAS